MPITIDHTWKPITTDKDRLCWRDEWFWKQQLKRQNDRIDSVFGDEPDFWDSDLFIISDSEQANPNDFYNNEIKSTGILVIELATENSTRMSMEYDRALWVSRRLIDRQSNLTIIEEEQQQEILDWDAHIEAPPPPRISGTVKVSFKYIGRSRPIPVDDPWSQ